MATGARHWSSSASSRSGQRRGRRSPSPPRTAKLPRRHSFLPAPQVEEGGRPSLLSKLPRDREDPSPSLRGFTRRWERGLPSRSPSVLRRERGFPGPDAKSTGRESFPPHVFQRTGEREDDAPCVREGIRGGKAMFPPFHGNFQGGNAVLPIQRSF